MVEQLLTFPIEECGEPFESLPRAAERANVRMKFSASKIAGDLDRVYFLRESLVNDVVEIGRIMNERGWELKIEDGYRSKEMQSQLVRKPSVFDSILNKCIWECEGTVPPAEFVFRRAIVLVANIPKIGTHMSGSAVDVSVFEIKTGEEVWRGNDYLEMSERTPMRSPYVESAALENRLEITELMESRGFMHFPFEFWHYNKDDAGAHILTGRSEPAKYGPVHWNVDTNEVVPYDDPLSPLNPLDVIEREINAAIARRTTE